MRFNLINKSLQLPKTIIYMRLNLIDNRETILLMKDSDRISLTQELVK